MTSADGIARHPPKRPSPGVERGAPDIVKLERNDDVTVSADKHSLYFRFNNYGGIDGLDFRTHCAPSIRFDLRADGAPVNPAEVIIGGGEDKPGSVPFAVRRQSCL
jgi:hypothetical protein